MPKIKKTSDSFKASTRLPGLQYRNSRGLGAYIDGHHRELDAAFVELETELTNSADAECLLIVNGTAVIQDDQTNSGNITTGLGLGSWAAKPFILQRTDTGGVINATRFTAIVQGDGIMVISSRNDAGALTAPGNAIDVTISWMIDAR